MFIREVGGEGDVFDFVVGPLCSVASADGTLTFVYVGWEVWGCEVYRVAVTACFEKTGHRAG